MMLKRAIAALISATVLATQLWTILDPADFAGWYWPFINYPMYSVPHHRGDVSAMHRLTGTSCSAGPDREISFIDIGVTRFRFMGRLKRIVGEASADPEMWSTTANESERYAQKFASLVASRVPEAICTLHVWERAVVLGETDDPYNVAWKRMRSWETASHSETTP